MRNPPITTERDTETRMTGGASTPAGGKGPLKAVLRTAPGAPRSCRSSNPSIRTSSVHVPDTVSVLGLDLSSFASAALMESPLYLSQSTFAARAGVLAPASNRQDSLQGPESS